MKKRTELQWEMLEKGKYKTINSFNHELNEGFIRPVYQYTSKENDTVAQFHKDDYLKARSIYER